MINRKKRTKRIWNTCLAFCFIIALLGSLIGECPYKIQAADALSIVYNGAVVNPADTLVMRTSSIQLMLQTSGVAYDDPRYEVEWAIADSAARDTIASVEQFPDNKMICTVHALSPGTVTITVTVKDSMTGNSVLGSATCNVNVVFSVDTEANNDLFKQVNASDVQKSIVMYADDAPAQLSLNFGLATDAQWTSSNEEIVTVGQRTGLITPVGAGHTQILASYTPVGDPSTSYTATMDVYIIPKVSLSKDSGFRAQMINQKISSGTIIYTDTNFSNLTQSIRNKIVWVVKQDDGTGTPKVLTDSLGQTSDLISVTPDGMYDNGLRIEGTAGNYIIEFYTAGTYQSESNHTTAYSPSVFSFTLTANIGDKEETLSEGDSYDLAKAFGMTTEDFTKCFSSNDWDVAGGSFGTFATYDRTTAVLTINKGISSGTLTNKVRVNSSQKAYVAQLLGLDATDDSVLASMPTTFTVTIQIKDMLRLSEMSMTLSQGASKQLRAYYNGTYEQDVVWTSSDERYVTVDQDGTVHAIKNTTGDVTVTASLTREDGTTMTATCSVVVEAALANFTLVPNKDFTMAIGDSTTIKVDIGKQSITNAPLYWTKSPLDIIEVQPAADNKSAVITAKKTGRVELIVINSINGTQQSITITVEQPITSISLSEATMSMPFYQQGYNMNRNLSYAPTNATNTDVKWVSSDESVAYIDEDEGLIQFISAGTALISVYPVKNPNGIMASCLLTIVGSPNAISLDKTDITLNVSESSLIDVDFSPRNTETTFEITPTNEGIVNVSYDEDRRQLKVDAKKPGQTNLNLVSLEGLISVVKVTVKQPATAVAMTPKEVTVRTGSTVSTKTTLTPATSTDTVKYSTLDARIATVDANGNITGVSSGTTFVRVQTYNGTTAGPTDLIKVIVRDGVTGISIDSTEKTVEVGSSVTITTTFTPPTAYDKSMTWTSSNPSVAKVENSGVSNAKVTGVKEGIVLITGKSNDGSYTVACLVTVVPKSTKWDTKVTIKPATKYLQVKKSAYLTATVTGSTNKKVTWKSSKKSVVTVSSSGKITGKKIGTAYVTATAKDGSGASARCKVRVVRKAKKVKLNKTSAKVLVGNTLKLKATVSPKNATIKKVKWKSSNKSIATVTASGRVLGVSPGRVKITATTTDGSNKKAVCYLTVKERVDADSIAPEQRQITVAKGKMCMANMVLSPSNSTSKIRYYSDNKRVATVNSRGKITTKRVGQAFIYAETDNGLEAYCEVLVVDLNRKDIVMRQYDTEQLSLNEELDKNLDWNGNGIGSNQDQNYQASHKVTWYSKNPRIASVSSNGLVTGKKKGTTIVYAVINGIKLGCRVTVRKIR